MNSEYLNQKESIQTSASFTSLTTPSQYFSKPIAASINSASSCSSIDDETVKKFKNLKVSSQQPGSLQLLYKKKTQSSNVSSATSSSSSISISSKIKTRSRSHSRSKLSYLATAAIKSMSKTSPNSSKIMLSSISTQTNVRLFISRLWFNSMSEIDFLLLISFLIELFSLKFLV